MYQGTEYDCGNYFRQVQRRRTIRSLYGRLEGGVRQNMWSVLRRRLHARLRAEEAVEEAGKFENCMATIENRRFCCGYN
jgi:hypothetical protein